MVLTLPKDSYLTEGYNKGKIINASVDQYNGSDTQYLELVVDFGKVQITKRFFFTIDYQCSNCRATFDKPGDVCPHCRNKIIYEPHYWLIQRLFKNLGIQPIDSQNGTETYDENLLVGKEVIALLYHNQAGYLEIFNLLNPDASRTAKAKLLIKLENYLDRKSPDTIERNSEEVDVLKSPF